MTDDPRLEAVARAWHRDQFGEDGIGDHGLSEARLFCAMIRAFLGEDTDRKEVMPHRSPERAKPEPDNATAPVDAGADPPWLDDAADAARRHTGAPLTPWVNIHEWSRGYWRAAIRAALRVASAQPAEQAEITAALKQWFPEDKRGNLAYNKVWRSEMRAALEAAAKVRAGG